MDRHGHQWLSKPEESEKTCFDLCQAPTCKPPNRPCAGRGSNHSADVKPRGAIDVSDQTRFGQLMADCPFSPRIRNAMPAGIHGLRWVSLRP